MPADDASLFANPGAMAPESAPARVARLRAELARHESLYRRGEPEITDYAFDTLKRELDALLVENPGSVEAAADGRGGGLLPFLPGDDHADGFAKAAHLEPMLSIANVYSDGEFHSLFVTPLSTLLRTGGVNIGGFVVEPKLDGVSASLTYENGVFTRAVTRGRLGGSEGDDITRNIETIATLPRELAPPFPARVELRGEVYMSNAEFLRINAARAAAGQTLYANPRNLAAGTVKLLDPAEAAARRLEIVLYGMGHCDPPGFFPTLVSLRDALVRWGLPHTDFFERANTPEEALAAVRRLEGIRHGLAYPTDGAVVKLDSLSSQAAAGATAHHYRWAIAYKFAPEQARTRLRAITLETGRTGVITPVAELDPVELSGSTISRATLHNADELARKDIREGDTVIVEKAGEIIPQIVRVDLEKRPSGSVPFDFAARLAELRLDAVREPGSPFWRLKTLTEEQRCRQLQHFVSKQCLDIENLGPASIAALVQNGLVRTPGDFFTLRRESLLGIGRFAEKSADKLLAAIGAARARPLWRLLHALGIPNVGMQTAKDLARHFRTLDAIAAASYGDYRRRVRRKDWERQEAAGMAGEELFTKQEESVIEGVGVVVANSLLSWFSYPPNRELVESLRKAGLNLGADDAVGGGGQTGQSVPQDPEGAPLPPSLFLDGKIFVLTGTLPTLSRDAAREKIEAAGGRVSGSVSAKTHYVVAGEEAGGKLEKARSLGIPVLDEASFLDLFSEGDAQRARSEVIRGDPRKESSSEEWAGGQSTQGELPLF
ncbi:MAG: NAD-dependent DNA ligase LigA [Puniceicoccales bacterium]|jgi:DNA ligase (NAD+)|nr:NAD-dependent DNA ligase LigA [Puniceicoccales bacterium]